jgi:hypothetical protein
MNKEELYMTDIEASKRYKYSRSWFQRARWAGTGPPFLKFSGKVLYPIKETDEWFKSHGLINNTGEFIKTKIA